MFHDVSTSATSHPSIPVIDNRSRIARATLKGRVHSETRAIISDNVSENVSSRLFSFVEGERKNGSSPAGSEDGIVRFAAGKGKPRQFGDKPHVRHGILIRWECWPTAKRPQRFLNTRRKWVASVPVPVSSRHRGCSGSKEGEPFMASNYFFSGRSISLFDRWRDFLVKGSLKEEKRKIVGEFSSFSTIARRKEWSAASFPIPKDSGRKFARIRSRRRHLSLLPYEVPLYSVKTAPLDTRAVSSSSFA